MTIKSKLRKIVPILCEPDKFFKTYQKIILLSHMRSRSSVLSHVIGGHKEISGYYEQHIDHKKNNLKGKIKVNLLIDKELKADTRYIYDKVLHSRLDPQSLSSYRVIVMVREPAATIKSIMALGQQVGSQWSDMLLAVTYYQSRLSDILSLLKKKPDVSFCFIRSEYFVDNNEQCLKKFYDMLATFILWM